MIVKKKGGMTEFIPSPQEKREGLIRDHVLELLENLHKRLSHLECRHSGELATGTEFCDLMNKIKKSEFSNMLVYSQIYPDDPVS